MFARSRVLILTIIVLAFGARVYHLTGQSIWPDEAYSVLVSHWSVAQLVDGLRPDNMPLYTGLLGVWENVAGDSEFSLRYFSILCGLPSVPLLYILGRRLIGEKPAIAAALLLAFSPWHIYYSQEVRMYALVGTLGLVATWIFLRRPLPTRPVLALMVVVLGALVWTHLFGLFLIVVHALIAVARDVRRLGRWLLVWLVVLLSLLPWMVLRLGIFRQFALSRLGQPATDFGSLLQGIATDLTVVSRGQLNPNVPADAATLRIFTMIALGFFFVAALGLLPGRDGHNEGRLIIGLHFIVPMALLLGLIVFFTGFATRYAFVATVWLPALVATGIWRLPPAARLVVLTGLLGTELWSFALYDGKSAFARLDFRSVIQSIAVAQAPGDVVVMTPDVAPTYAYYADRLRVQLPTTVIPDAAPMGPDDVVTLARAASGERRLWRLRWQTYFYDPVDYEGSWLNAHAIRSNSWHIGQALDLELWLLQPPLLDQVPGDAIPDSAWIDDLAQLVGHQVTRDSGGRVTLTLYWRLTRPLDADYSEFIHLFNENGRIIGQGDELPYAGQYSTSHWPVGPIVRDPHTFSLTAEPARSEATLEVGFYVLETMQRLGAPGHDTIRLPVAAPPRVFQRPALPLRLLPMALRLD